MTENGNIKNVHLFKPNVNISSALMMKMSKVFLKLSDVWTYQNGCHLQKGKVLCKKQLIYW